MKKIIVISLFFLFTNVLCEDEIETDQYELPLQQKESDEGEFDLPPIFVNISVSNINEIHSNNKTNVCQEQETAKELEKKKQENRQRLLKYAKTAVIVAALLSSPHKDPAILSYIWKSIW